MIKSIRKVLRNNIQIVHQVHALDKGRILMTSLYWMCDIVEIIIYNVLLLPFLYYAVDHSVKIQSFLVIEGILTLVLIFCNIYQTFYNMKYAEKSNQRITHRYITNIYFHIKKADINELYDSNQLDLIVRLLNSGANNLTSALDMHWWAVSVIILGIVYLGVLIKIDALLIIVALLSSISMFFINIKLNKLDYKNMVENSKTSRKIQYIVNIFSLREYSQDLRTTDLKDVLTTSMQKVVLEINKRINTITRQICNYTYIKNITIFIITTSITWLYLAIKYLVLHHFTLGVAEIIVAQTMMMQLCNLLINVSTIGPGLQKSSMYADEYFRYIETESDIKENEAGDMPNRGANSIQIKNISFSYDGKNKILENINMHIHAGEKIAIVGKNGAGKSTLVKLLLRLYEPQEGQIEMDQKPADTYILKEYRERFGVAFQDTQLYSVSVAENVLMKTYKGEEKEKDRVINALKRGKLYNRIIGEDKGIDTTVTKEFDGDGIELSGGQIQKLAISRVFARDCGVVILDEPSASLDPMSEAEMYESMLEAMKEKTVILISHRLSVCRNVDRVYVMDEGEIVEEGTHSQLLKENGLYARMWNLQVSGYK